MKLRIVLGLFCLRAAVASTAAESLPEALLDPIPEKITKGDITVVAQEFLRLPQTLDASDVPLSNEAYARIQYMQPIPDESGRLVINELRGVLYIYDEAANTLDAFLDIRDAGIGFDDSMFPNETGLAGFAFHPQFAQPGRPGYGKFYTAFSASSDSGVANYLDDNSDNHESVIREWTATDAGSRKSLVDRAEHKDHGKRGETSEQKSQGRSRQQRPEPATGERHRGALPRPRRVGPSRPGTAPA